MYCMTICSENVILLYVGNEWKTRYETQTEINEQLERQILVLQNKVQEAKANLKDGMYPRVPHRGA